MALLSNIKYQDEYPQNELGSNSFLPADRLCKSDKATTGTGPIPNPGAAPTIATFTEHAKGGDDITITGTGFSTSREKNIVTINGKLATVTLASSTSIAAKVPAEAGDGMVIVEVDGKKASSTKKFIYDWKVVVSTVAGNGSTTLLNNPSGIAQAADGAIYVTDRVNHRIRKIELQPGSNSLITTLAGSNSQESGNTDGYNTAARFSNPYDITIDETGTLYVADGSWIIRKISSEGHVTTLKRNTNASFSISCRGIAVYGKGNLIIPDYANNNISHFSSAGELSTIAGTTSNGPAFSKPRGVVCTKDGNEIYIVDAGNNRIQHLTKNIDGTYSQTIKAGSTDNASFNMPAGIAMDGQGNLFVVDEYNHMIKRIVTQTDGSITVSAIAGTGALGFKDDVGANAMFQYPSGIITNSEGTILYITDSGNNRIRKITLQ